MLWITLLSSEPKEREKSSLYTGGSNRNKLDIHLMLYHIQVKSDKDSFCYDLGHSQR